MERHRGRHRRGGETKGGRVGDIGTADVDGVDATSVDVFVSRRTEENAERGRVASIASQL